MSSVTAPSLKRKTSATDATAPKKSKVEEKPKVPKMDEDDDDDKPLIQRAKVENSNGKTTSTSSKIKAENDDDDDDKPLLARIPVKKEVEVKKEEPVVKKEAVKKEEPVKKAVPVKKETTTNPAKKTEDPKKPVSVKKEEPAKKATPAKKPAGKKKADSSSDSSSDDSSSDSSSESSSDSDSSDEDDKPLIARKVAATVKKEPKKEEGAESSKKPAKRSKKNDDEEEVYEWWKEQGNDGEIKWNTLIHNGVLFPPEYKPHKIPLIYDGKQIVLPPEAEEVATFFAGVVGTDHGKNPVFQKNFFHDFLEVLKQCDKKSPIKEFSKCDFSLMVNYLQELKEKKKNRSKAEKEEEKQTKKAIDEKYGIALVNGRKEKIGNFRVEPPGLFRGRGSHPKTGSLKKRVTPEMITINIGKGASVPQPPKGHQWAKVVHDQTVTWLATWEDNVNQHPKYVFLAANSTFRGKSDMKKYDKARELKKHIVKIRQVYTADLKDKMTVVRQTATALYLIDKLALRAGNEKDTDEEADTVGCCSLRVEHVELREPNIVVFDFLGKDSMRYYNEVPVDPQVFKNLQIFKQGNKDNPKKVGDMLFDRITPAVMNKHLQNLMAGLTAKVFRTYNASITFAEELKKTPKTSNVQELVLAYNRANREAAILCNHQRTVPKSFETSMAKLSEKLLILKYERRLIRKQLLAKDKKKKKEIPALGEEESDIDDEKEKDIEKLIDQREQEKEEKRIEKLKEEAQARGEKFVPPEKKEREKEKEKISSLSVEQLERRFKTVEDRIEKARLEITDRDENKTTALGTSKINYLDPRITVAWCKKHDVPLEKVFTKTLREKFRWAWDCADKNWTF